MMDRAFATGGVVINTARGPMSIVDAFATSESAGISPGRARRLLWEPPVRRTINPSYCASYRSRETWWRGRLIITAATRFPSSQGLADDTRRKRRNTMRAALVGPRPAERHHTESSEGEYGYRIHL